MSKKLIGFVAYLAAFIRKLLFAKSVPELKQTFNESARIVSFMKSKFPELKTFFFFFHKDANNEHHNIFYTLEFTVCH